MKHIQDLYLCELLFAVDMIATGFVMRILMSASMDKLPVIVRPGYVN